MEALAYPRMLNLPMATWDRGEIDMFLDIGLEDNDDRSATDN
jgi:hypothetical protein